MARKDSKPSSGTELKAHFPAAESAADTGKKDIVQRLEDELQAARDALQCANQELETSREELQSLNEELSTVNAQLEEKVDQLEEANDDLSNLLVSTEIATVFLDPAFHIRRFTPAASVLLNLIPADIGRPMSDLSPRVKDGQLLDDVQKILDKSPVEEKEVRSTEGRTYVRKVRPYRSSENQIEGVVVTYSDVSNLIEARRRIERRERQQAEIAGLGRLALTLPDLDALFEETVRRVQQRLEADFTKVLELNPAEGLFLLKAGVGWDAGLVGRASVSAGTESQAGFTMMSRDPVIVQDLQSETRFSGPPLLLEHGVTSGMSVVIGRPDHPWGVLGVHMRARREFTPDDVSFIQAVAHVLSEAIEAKDHERRLRESEDRLRLSQRAGGVGSWDWNLADGTAQWSDEMFQLCGISPESGASATRWFEMVHPSDRARVVTAIQAAQEGKEPYDTEFCFIRGDGEERWLRGRGEVVFSHGKPVRMLGVNIDVTERKRDEQARRRIEELQAIAVDAAGLIHWDWDLVEERVIWGPGAHRLYGLDSLDQADTTEAALNRIHADDRAAAREDALLAIEGTQPYESEFRVVWPDGSVHWILAKGRVTERHPDGRATRMVGVNLDTTRLKRAEEELREADRQKNLFLATLAHELRNPLAPIRTGIELLHSMAGDPKRVEQICATMERQTLHLVALVDDLLDVSRITRGELELRRALVPLSYIVLSALESSQPLIDARRHELTVELPPEPLTLYADQNRLSQILSNLLNNATRYTPEGGKIKLTVSSEGNDLLISVKDNGIGIPPERQELIFQTFAQFGRISDHAGSSGLGIGLTLVKSLVERHGGTVQVISGGEEVGSEFRLRLPIVVDSAPAASEEPQTEEESQPKRRVLVVDDNDAAAEMLGVLLKAFGHEVHVVRDGAKAIEEAEEFRPEVVLLDLGMPGMDGFEAARSIRSKRWGKHIRLVAITGWGQEADKAKTRAAGFDRHLVKPASADDLRAVIDEADGPEARD